MARFAFLLGADNATQLFGLTQNPPTPRNGTQVKVSLATIMGSAEMWFCRGHGIRVSPLMGRHSALWWIKGEDV
jgi:hypothetical protein